MRYSSRKAKGYFQAFRHNGRMEEGETLQCVHCGKHWQISPGSGKRRGFCLNCNGPTCGCAACDACVPVEQKLANIEAGRPVYFRPVTAFISKTW